MDFASLMMAKFPGIPSYNYAAMGNHHHHNQVFISTLFFSGQNLNWEYVYLTYYLGILLTNQVSIFHISVPYWALLSRFLLDMDKSYINGTSRISTTLKILEIKIARDKVRLIDRDVVFKCRQQWYWCPETYLRVCKVNKKLNYFLCLLGPPTANVIIQSSPANTPRNCCSY